MKFWFYLLSTLPIVSAFADITFDRRTFRIRNEALQMGSGDPISLTIVFEFMEKKRKMDSGRPFRSIASLNKHIQNLNDEINGLKALAARPLLPGGALAVLEQNIREKESELEYAEATLENFTLLIDFLKQPHPISMDASGGLDGKGESLSSLMSAISDSYEPLRKELKEEAERKKSDNERNARNKKYEETEKKRKDAAAAEVAEKKEWEENKIKEHEAYRRFGGCTADCYFEVPWEDSIGRVFGYFTRSVQVIRSGNRRDATDKLEKGCSDLCRFTTKIKSCTLAFSSIDCEWK
jgi:hypothetical protein